MGDCNTGDGDLFEDESIISLSVDVVIVENDVFLMVVEFCSKSCLLGYIVLKEHGLIVEFLWILLIVVS